MKKSMKKIAASLVAATMVLGTVSTAFAYEAESGAIKDLEDGEKLFLAVGNMSPSAWDTKSEANIMKAVEGKEGVYSMELTFPAYTEDEKWASRFAIVGNVNVGDDYAVGGWSRMLVGEADYVANDTFTCLSNIRVACETETTTTVYFDSRTATVYIQDAEGNDVDYKLSWVGNDDDEQYLTVDEYAATTYDDYYTALSTDDRRSDLDKINEIKPLSKALFDGTYKANVEGLKNYIATGTDYVKGAEEPTEDPTTEAPTTETPTEAPTTAAPTQAPTTAAPKAAAPAGTKTVAPTTAKNQATKTGDVAPVALFATLVASVAVVTIAAKKKEA